MDYGLKDRVAVITGASSGIGFATAQFFLELGAKVAVCARNPENLARAAEELVRQSDANRVYSRPCDVLVDSEVRAFRDGVAAQFGATDILVNNAGESRIGNFDELSDEAWMDECRLKLFSVIYPTRAFRPMLRQSDAAAIVNINAMVSQRPHPHMISTSAARAALLNMSKAMSIDFARDGIRVNSVLIGLVRSGQWDRRYEKLKDKYPTREDYLADIAAQRRVPMARFGEASEAASVIAFLASPGASYITGSWIDVTGGMKPNA